MLLWHLKEERSLKGKRSLLLDFRVMEVESGLKTKGGLTDQLSITPEGKQMWTASSSRSLRWLKTFASNISVLLITWTWPKCSHIASPTHSSRHARKVEINPRTTGAEVLVPLFGFLCGKAHARLSRTVLNSAHLTIRLHASFWSMFRTTWSHSKRSGGAQLDWSVASFSNQLKALSGDP